jgi:hypothetical protein
MSTLSVNTIEPLSGTTITIPSDLTVTGNILLSGSIIPNTNGVSSTSSFNLGSPTAAWKDIYVSNGTINFLDAAGTVTQTLGTGNNQLIGTTNIIGNTSITGTTSITGSLYADSINDVYLSKPLDSNQSPSNLYVGDPYGIYNSSVMTGSNNNFFGVGGGLITGGSNNNGFGFGTLLNATTGYSNIAVGTLPLYNLITGFLNIAIGNQALNDTVGGNNNIAIGHQALSNNNTISARNVAIGNNSGQDLGLGTDNTFLGHQAGQAITTGSQNTVIGAKAQQASFLSGNNNIVIGYNAEASSNTVSNQITLGNNSITTLRCQATTITSLSDARDKKEIIELSAGLDFVNTLKPVEFVWDDRDKTGKHNIKDFGFIAQDLKKSQEDIDLAETLKLVYEENPEKLEASYGKLIPILVKAIQDLSKEIKILKNKQ